MEECLLRVDGRREAAMKVVTILGSPKLKGNTSATLARFEKLAAQEHEIDRINIADLDVGGCLGCYACQRNPNEPACVQKDDALGVFDRILEADAVVYASPLYMWGLASGIRALMERHLCLVTGYMTPSYKSLVAGKRAALLVTCGGAEEGNADLIQQTFDRFADYAQYDSAGKHVVPLCTTPDKLGEAADAAAEKLSKDIAGQ
jgi:multimeric flavodoxin WrbA